MKKLGILCVVVSLLFVCAGSSRAAFTVPFADNFDSYPTQSNWPGGGEWTVSGGTVDIIGDTPFPGWFDLLPGNGNYVDMDGSTSDGGMITASGTANPGFYTLSVDLAGNQRGYGLDTVNVVVSGGFLNTSVDLADTDPFTTYSWSFVVPSTTAISVSFEDIGSDQNGALLDNVSLTYRPDVIPAPSAVLLGGIGAAVVGWLRRRRIV